MNDTPSTLNLLAVRPGLVRILWAAFFFCLLPFIIVSFFNGMSTDDYTLYANYREHGFLTTQKLIYTGWTGRYTSTFLGTLFMKFNLPDHYFLPALLLFIFSWGALFFLLSAVNRNNLANLFTRPKLALASSILLMATIYVQAEIATGFYWFSAAITYQTAFIFFLLLGGLLIKRFSLSAVRQSDPGGNARAIAPRRYRSADGLILLLIVLMNGCNEVTAVFLALFLLMLVIAAYYYRRAVPAVLVVYFAVSLITGMIIVFSSGIFSGRYAMMNSHTSYAAILPIILFRTASVFYYVLKVPLFWIAGSLLFMTGRWIAQQTTVSFLAAYKDRKVLVPGLLAIAALVLLTLTGVLLASKGSLPDRALNNLIDLTTMALLALAFITGSIHTKLAPSSDASAFSRTPAQGRSSFLPATAFVFFLAAGLVASDPFAEAWKSTFSGYFYHSVQEGRRQAMREASNSHQRTVLLEPYDTVLAGKLHRAFPHGVFVTVRTLLVQKPALLLYGNDPYSPDPGWLSYYNLDSITVRKY